MKVESKIKPDSLAVEKQGSKANVSMAYNIEKAEKGREGETEQVYQFERIVFELPYRRNLKESIENNFKTYAEFGKQLMEEKAEKERQRKETQSLIQNYNQVVVNREQGVELSEREINEIEQGQEITELEIQLVEVLNNG